MRALVLLLVVSLLCFAVFWLRKMLWMPAAEVEADAPAMMNIEVLAEALGKHVQKLASEIGPRNTAEPEALAAAADYIERQFEEAGFAVERQQFRVQAAECENLEVGIPGGSRADEILIIGAHYDTVFGSPGANDNGSGVAALLELARAFADAKLERTLRFVAFTNEEPPWSWSENMGSRRYASRCRERGENIIGMISLETIGYYDDAPGSQKYPLPALGLVYPDQGNFIGFVANTASGAFMKEALAEFRRVTDFPSEGAALPAVIPGVGWSDHWSFWQENYSAFMITDTAPFRYPHYHAATDTPEHLDYKKMAQVVAALREVIARLAGTPK